MVVGLLNRYAWNLSRGAAWIGYNEVNDVGPARCVSSFGLVPFPNASVRLTNGVTDDLQTPSGVLRARKLERVALRPNICCY
jgi:hypothetical protein